MKNGKTIVLVIEPSAGGHLIPRASSERAGHANYSVKRDWRREFDVEVRREGHDYFYPLVNLPIGNQPFPQNQPSQPVTSLPITLLHEVRHPNGDLAVIAGTVTDIYTMFPYKNMMPYFEPGATPDDDYVDPNKFGKDYIDGGGTVIHPGVPTGSVYGYGYNGGVVTETSGPVPLPPPTDAPPDTPTPDPSTLIIPYGIDRPGLGQPDITPPAGFTMDQLVPVNAGYYFFTTLDDEGHQIIPVDDVDDSVVQALGVLLAKNLAYMIGNYKKDGWTVAMGNTSWWETSSQMRPLSAAYKIAVDPTLDPASGIGDSAMGGFSESVWVGTVATYFFAYPPG